MSSEIWSVLHVEHHPNGDTTLTMRNDETGVVKTEDYPPGAMVNRVVKQGEE